MLIREARIEDAQGIAKVHVNSWRTTYKGLISENFLANLSVEKSRNGFREALSQRAEQEFMYVAEDTSGEIVGFAVGGKERTGDSVYDGEIYAIYLLKEYQRQGIGRRLIKAVADKLESIGLKAVLVWVLADNPSLHFYEALGGKAIYKKTMTIDGKELKEVGYAWTQIADLISR